MTTKMWTLVGVVLMLAAFLAGIGGLRDGGTPAKAQEADPAELYQQFVEAFNAGDTAGVLAVFAEDAEVSVTIFSCVLSPCVGHDAIQRFAETAASINVSFTIVSIEASGNTATGQQEVRGDVTQFAGVDRLLRTFTAEVTGDKISSLQTEPVEGDEQNDAMAEWLRANLVGFSMGPGRDADQSGAVLMEPTIGDRTLVFVDVEPGPAGVLQPIHIHEGSCPDVGAVAFPLQDVLAGKSGTVLDLPIDDLRTGDFAINVHQSADEAGVYVSCGDIPALAAEEPETTAPVAGSGPLDGGNALPIWWFAIVGAGMLLVLGGLATRGSARRGG